MKKQNVKVWILIIVAGIIALCQPEEGKVFAKTCMDCREGFVATLANTTVDGVAKLQRKKVAYTTALDLCDVELEDTQYTYNMREQKPEVTVSYHGKVLEEDEDYEVSYEDNINAGEAKVIITGCGTYEGTVTKTFSIDSKDIIKCDIELYTESFSYDGTEQESVPGIYDGNVCLEVEKDYVVSYEDNIQVGTAKAIIKGIGNYKGEVIKNFSIEKAEQWIDCKSSYSKKYNSKPFLLDVSIFDGDGTLSYKSSKPAVATVNAKGKVTIKKAGKTTITVTASETENYAKTVEKITISVEAKKKVFEKITNTFQEGRYIYYSFNKGGASMGLKRYDTKTGKKKLIKARKKIVGGFDCIEVKGKYIYMQGNSFPGSGGDINYIYRIRKDGKKMQKLAKGRSPVIVGKYIYYIKTRFDKEIDSDQDTNVICKMKLDGTGKKVVKRLNKNTLLECLGKCDNKLVYLIGGHWERRYCYLSGKEIKKDTIVMKWNTAQYSEEAGIEIAAAKVGNYKYYTNKNKNKLYRKNVKTGKSNTVAAFKGKEKITYFSVYGSYVIIETDKYNKATNKEWTQVYCIKGNGTSKKKIEKWNPAA